MKKLLFIISIFAIIFSSCEKDEDDPIFDQTDLYGTWTQISPDPAIDDYDSIYHEFTEANYKVTNYTNGNYTSITYLYTWTENNFSYEVFGINVSNEVTTLNASTLTFVSSALGTSETYTCTKVE